MYKKFIDGKKVVCFDLDGTIVNSEPIFAMAFANVLHLVNPNIRLGTVYGQIGEPVYERWARLVNSKQINTPLTIKDLTTNTSAEFLKLLNNYEVVARPGFWDLITKIKDSLGLKLALATNTSKAVAMQEISKLDIEGVFDFMVFGDEVKNRKPDPEIYQKVINFFKIKPHEILVFEDSLVGTRAASSAGTGIVVVWDGQTDKNRFPKETMAFVTDFVGMADYLEYSVDDVLEILRKLDASAPQRQQTQN